MCKVDLKHADWFMFYIWLFALIAGITLLILSGSKRYIDWVKERMPMPEEKIMKLEKSGAIGLIIISVLSLLRVLLKN